MAKRVPQPRVVVVTGDVTIDWNLARTRRGPSGAAWNPHDMARAYRQPGGAMLLGDLISALAARSPGPAGRWKVAKPPAPDLGSPASRHTQSYASWSKHASPGTPPVWRVEEFLGLAAPTGAPAGRARRAAPDPQTANIVVLDDANLGFRNDRSRWPIAITGRRTKPWVVVKMASPVAEGALWNHLVAAHADRLIVVMTANDLRRTAVQVSRELSWERTAQDLAWELAFNPHVASLRRAAHVVVSFDGAGAFLSSRRDRQMDCRLFFDPVAIEGAWADGKGQMIGYSTCLAGSLVRELLAGGSKPDLGDAIQRGVAAMRELFARGYGVESSDGSEFELVFPTKLVAGVLSAPEVPRPLAEVAVPVAGTDGNATSNRVWSILEQRDPKSIGRLAEDVARRGLGRALHGVPIGKFTKLETADRGEIEGLRAIRTTVQEYLQQSGAAPLCLAVFGPPGAGKSFGVKQVAKALLPNAQELPFNLSQLGGPEALRGAFHQVRDAALAGKVPLVFWDEFDTAVGGEPLGWLRHFLAPMQDGVFQEGQVTHPIGRAIFVFAGGTRSTLESFIRDHPNDFTEKKGPDFVSRLRGHLNIVGPNPRLGAPDADPQFLVRRAILLRSLLRDKAPQLFAGDKPDAELRIDEGVLRGFLETREYRNGARSMESIIATSRLAGKTTFERSSLPAGEQLKAHVDHLDFLSRVNQLPLDAATIAKLAPEVHDSFCRLLRELGYRPGKVTDDKALTHSSLKPFSKLPENEKAQNRANAADIPDKLAEVGLAMIPAREPGPLFAMPLEAVELLADREHDRWMRMKIAAGWHYAKETDKAKRRHQDLLPWKRASVTPERYTREEQAAMGPDELSETAKEKDRYLVRDIPHILAAVGYAVVRTERGV
ncbi:MAG: RyR domain-containing protein [Gemmatimonadales bacterium]